jgi:hypothetical protein
MRESRPKPLVVGQRTELRDGRQFKLLVLEPSTHDYLLDVEGFKHFPAAEGLALGRGNCGNYHFEDEDGRLARDRA